MRMQNLADTENAVEKKVSESLQQVIDEEQKEFDRHQSRTLRFYWERGRVVLALRAGRDVRDRRRAADYGDNPVETLADALKQDRSTLYRAGQFADMFPDEAELESLTAKIREHGATTGFSHIKTLLGLPSGKGAGDSYHRHRQLLNKVIEENWSLSKLAAEVESRRERQTAPVRPKSRGENFVDNVKKFNQVMVKHVAATDELVIPAIEQMLESPPDNVTYEMLESLRKAEQQLLAEKARIDRLLPATRALLAKFEASGSGGNA